MQKHRKMKKNRIAKKRRQHRCSVCATGRLDFDASFASLVSGFGGAWEPILSQICTYNCNAGTCETVFGFLIAICILHPRNENRTMNTHKQAIWILFTSESHFLSLSLSRLSSVAWQICKNVHFFVVVSIAWRAENIDTIRGSQTQVQRLSRLLFFRFLWNGYRRLLHTRNVGTAPRAKNVQKNPNENNKILQTHFEKSAHTAQLQRQRCFGITWWFNLRNATNAWAMQTLIKRTTNEMAERSARNHGSRNFCHSINQRQEIYRRVDRWSEQTSTSSHASITDNFIWKSLSSPCNYSLVLTSNIDEALHISTTDDCLRSYSFHWWDVRPQRPQFTMHGSKVLRAQSQLAKPKATNTETIVIFRCGWNN